MCVLQQAIRELCTKYPVKHRVLIGFLSTFLREEGGYEFKRAVVESMFDLIKFVPDSKEDALAHLDPALIGRIDQHHSELFASNSRDHILRLTNTLREGLCKSLEAAIACRVTIVVVVELEKIHIQQDHADLFWQRLCPPTLGLQDLSQGLVKMSAIR